jgi:hypothetical protein
MNELVLEEMYSFMTFSHRQEIKGMVFPSGVAHFKEIFLRINHGCPCTKVNREQHAEITYKNTMLTLPVIDQQELKVFLGIGEEYSKVIIKDRNVFLLELLA